MGRLKQRPEIFLIAVEKKVSLSQTKKTRLENQDSSFANHYALVRIADQWRTQKIFMGGLIQWHMVVFCIWCTLFVTS